MGAAGGATFSGPTQRLCCSLFQREKSCQSCPGKGEASEVVPRAHLWSLSSAQLLGGRHVRIARALEPAGPGFDSCVATDIQGLREIYVSTLSCHTCISYRRSLMPSSCHRAEVWLR